IAKKDQSVNPDRKGGVVIKMNASELEELAGKSAPVDEFEFFKKAKAGESKDLKITTVPYADILKWDIESDKYRSINPETGKYDSDEKYGRMSEGYPDKCDGKNICAYMQQIIVNATDGNQITATLGVGDVASDITESGIVHGVFLAFTVKDTRGRIIGQTTYEIGKIEEVYKEKTGKEMKFGSLIVERGPSKKGGEYITIYVNVTEVPGERVKPNSFMLAFGYRSGNVYGGVLQQCMRD
ncbi:MAG: hypothetical protein ACP5NX_02095, partial [Candidatus Bilamarchaeaceae archaeon]